MVAMDIVAGRGARRLEGGRKTAMSDLQCSGEPASAFVHKKNRAREQERVK
jgi:hypothetical protein